MKLERARNKGTEKIKWSSTLTLPELDSAEEQQALARELLDAIAQGWRCLGKRNVRFGLSIHTPPACAYHEYFAPHEQAERESNLAVVVLQTDALLFDGRRLAEHEGAYPNIKEPYRQYWSETTGGSCKLVRFFARQNLAGGFQAKNNFKLYDHYPFVLTEAGSVFVLEMIDPEKANDELQRFNLNGLPLPSDIMVWIGKHSIGDTEAWRKCPFVPQTAMAKYGSILHGTG